MGTSMGKDKYFFENWYNETTSKFDEALILNWINYVFKINFALSKNLSGYPNNLQMSIS